MAQTGMVGGMVSGSVDGSVSGSIDRGVGGSGTGGAGGGGGGRNPIRLRRAGRRPLNGAQSRLRRRTGGIERAGAEDEGFGSQAEVKKEASKREAKKFGAPAGPKGASTFGMAAKSDMANFNFNGRVGLAGGSGGSRHERSEQAKFERSVAGHGARIRAPREAARQWQGHAEVAPASKRRQIGLRGCIFAAAVYRVLGRAEAMHGRGLRGRPGNGMEMRFLEPVPGGGFTGFAGCFPSV